jgi:CRISPR-associated protein Cas5h
VKILTFDIWGDYAHFRRPWTTTSPLSFAIPPRTAIMGMLGAILGLKRGEYQEAFGGDRARIAVAILNPITKTRITENLLNTKFTWGPFRHGDHTQIRFELIRNPRYRIYVCLEDAAMHDKLKTMLKAHTCVYTPCLGLSECLANFSYVGEFRGNIHQNKDLNVDINSAIREDAIIQPEIEAGKEYASADMACDMTEGRIVTRYATIIYERNGLPIRARVTECIRLENGNNITFL